MMRNTGLPSKDETLKTTKEFYFVLLNTVMISYSFKLFFFPKKMHNVRIKSFFFGLPSISNKILEIQNIYVVKLCNYLNSDRIDIVCFPLDFLQGIPYFY